MKTNRRGLFGKVAGVVAGAVASAPVVAHPEPFIDHPQGCSDVDVVSDAEGLEAIRTVMAEPCMKCGGTVRAVSLMSNACVSCGHVVDLATQMVALMGLK